MAAPEQGYASGFKYEITCCLATNSRALAVVIGPNGDEKEIWTQKINVFDLWDMYDIGKNRGEEVLETVRAER